MTWARYTDTSIVVYDDLGGVAVTLPRSATSDEVEAAFNAATQPEQEPDWARFKRIAMGSSIFTAIAKAIPPQSSSYLSAALIAAEEGRLGHFQFAWAEIVRQAGVSPEVVAGFVGIAAACNLPAEFLAALQPP